MALVRTLILTPVPVLVFEFVLYSLVAAGVMTLLVYVASYGRRRLRAARAFRRALPRDWWRRFEEELSDYSGRPGRGRAPGS